MSPENKKPRKPKGYKNPVPAALRAFIRENTDWSKVHAALQDKALGLYEFKTTLTGEERVYRNPPDTKALQVLTEFGWGKPGLMEEDADQAGVKGVAVVFVVPAQDMVRLERERQRAIKEVEA